jgi:SAM-dependent methyltransferase
MKVLDIGCFTGDFLQILHENGADVYGVELQTQAVAIANQKLSGRVIQADVYGNDYPQIEFDFIPMLGVIEHVIDPIKLLDRATELLASKGWLMIQTPNSNSFLARILQKYWPPYAPVEHIHLFSRKSLELSLTERGYETVVFMPHWKRLPISYIYNMLRNFGSEFYCLTSPLYKIMPNFIKNIVLPFYVGEMII